MEDWITIKNLKQKDPSLGTREIAKLLKVSRNTVKKALRESVPPKYSRPEIINDSLVPYEDFIKKRLHTDRIIGSRILDEIIQKGYNGSKSSYYRFLNKIKEKQTKTFMPYETAPGEQVQFDWSPYSVVIGGCITKVIVFSCILGFSRYRIYEASLSEKQSSVFEALENSFHQMGGMAERIQTDNATCFIDQLGYKNHRWNRRYIAFCAHYRIKPTRSLPGHPWSKGKVENPFDYLEDHFIIDNKFSSFDHFCNELKSFQNKVNDRVHATTNYPPSELFLEEQNMLSPLPESRYVGVYEENRKVTSDCLISFDGSRYSVPYIFAGKEVWVKVSKGFYLQVYSNQNQIIATHKLSLEKKKIIIQQEHYKNHRSLNANQQRLEEMFLEIFPEDSWFLEKLKIQKKINPRYHLMQIMEIAKYFPAESLRQAFLYADRLNSFSYIFIRGYLEQNYKLKEEKITETIAELSIHIDKSYLNKNITRPLTHYKISESK
jgi:transposase